MQYVFFKIGVWGIFENFCVKSKLTVCKVTFNCKLQKKLGLQDVLVAPPIILWGPCSPGSRAYALEGCHGHHPMN